MTVAVSGDSITFPDNSVQATAPKVGMVNRIINGAMVIDQRNAGAAVTMNASGVETYVTDRFFGGDGSDAVLTMQQVSDSPADFINSVKVTVTTADASIDSAQYSVFGQRIEGLNITDLNWGTANAKSVTLSFWVKSSVTGTLGGSLRNSSANRSYVFSYTISSANTWEQKSVIISGDTTGTWATNNGTGIILVWSLGDGSSRVGTAGSWSANNFSGVTGQTQLISTLNATWQVTGVQLEKGSTATSFDYRPYGTELALCQRYLPTLTASASGTVSTIGAGTSTTSARVVIPFTTTPRVSPTGVTVISVSNFGLVSTGSGGVTASSITFDSASFTGAAVNVTVGSGMTANGAHVMYQTAPAQLLFTGCEL